MVRTNNKKHSDSKKSSVTDLKAARIERNLNRLAELVNSSPETKNRTMEYLKMAKTNAERQAEYKARAKSEKRNLNYFISALAYQSLTDLSKESGKSKVETLESLLLSDNQLLSNDNLQNAELQNEIDRLNAEIEKLKESTNSKKLRELRQENKGLVQQNDKLYQQIVSLESKLKDSERDNLRMKTENENAFIRYQDLINLPVPDFAEFQKNYFIQYGNRKEKSNILTE